MDIFLKYLSSSVVFDDTIYIFNVIPLRIKYSSIFCFSALKRFFHSLSTKFPLNSRQLLGNLNRSSTRILFTPVSCIDKKAKLENIHERVKERLWRQLYLLRSNQG